jgi:hypothetical protein
MCCVNMFMSRYQKTEQKHSLKIENRSFEDAEKFKCLGTILTDKNCMHEEIKSRLNSGNALLPSLLSFHVLCWNIKLKYAKP